MPSKTDRNLATLHPDLRRVINLASYQPSLPFVVDTGKMSQSLLHKFVAVGLMPTIHEFLEGKACRLLPYFNRKVIYTYSAMEAINRQIQTAAHIRGIRITWCGSVNFYGTNRYDPSVYILETTE